MPKSFLAETLAEKSDLHHSSEDYNFPRRSLLHGEQEVQLSQRGRAMFRVCM